MVGLYLRYARGNHHHSAYLSADLVVQLASRSRRSQKDEPKTAIKSLSPGFPFTQMGKRENPKQRIWFQAVLDWAARRDYKQRTYRSTTDRSGDLLVGSVRLLFLGSRGVSAWLTIQQGSPFLRRLHPQLSRLERRRRRCPLRN